MPSLPTGVVTFLFTDIEGSTRLLTRDPDAYNAALATHNSLLEAAVRANRGVIFETIGEAIYASFADPVSAVIAAMHAQDGLQHQAWGAIGAIRVRMALDRGPVERRGRHYVGTALYRCARLIALAHGEQVLASADVASQVRGRLPPGASLIDLGPHRLRDFDADELVFQLAASQLRAAFPPLRSVRVSSGLPADLSTFVGRERELAEIDAALVSSRLVTLVGVGGCGKTRLARRIARDIEPRFEDGLRYVDLTAVSRPELVGAAIARALGVTPLPDDRVEESVLDHLVDKKLLLVIDNFEHVIEAALLLTRMLGSSPRLTILVTSRTALELSAERVIPVRPLHLPGNTASLSEIRESEAVALFVDRASGRDAAIALDRVSAPLVAGICRRLDGLPLAIELAAARVREMGLAALAERVAHSSRVLTRGLRDAPARHRRLRDTFAWSYDLLPFEARTFLSRASVFEGGFTETTADAVCAPPVPLSAVGEVIAVLVDASLLQVDSLSRVARYSMLHTVRDFASELLPVEEARALRDRHAVLLLDLLRPRAGEVEEDYLRRIELEHDNVRAALRWCIDEGRAEESVGLASGTLHLWQTRGHWAEGRIWLDIIRAMPALHGPSAMRAAVCYRAGILAHAQGDGLAATALYDEAAEIARQLADDVLLFKALLNLGILAAERRDHETALARYSDCQRLIDARGDIVRELNPAGFLINRAELDLDRGALADATARYREALQIFGQVGSSSGRAEALAGLGEIAVLSGDLPGARGHLYGSLELNESLGRHSGALRLVADLAIVAAAEGDGAVLEHHAERALALLADPLNVRLLPDAVIAAALVAEAREQWADAAALCAGLELLDRSVSLRVAPLRRRAQHRVLSAARSHGQIGILAERTRPLDLLERARSTVASIAASALIAALPA